MGKGSYARLAPGRLSGLTGADDPYEPPLNPALTLRTHLRSPGESAAPVYAAPVSAVPAARGLGVTSAAAKRLFTLSHLDALESPPGRPGGRCDAGGRDG
jgi:hypothetical protein